MGELAIGWGGAATRPALDIFENELETSKIEANLRDGVLTVRTPKRAELQPRRIKITS